MPIGYDLPRYRCRRATSGIVIDGVVDEQDWALADTIELRDVDGRVPYQKTTVKALYDDTTIYVAFECWDTEIWSTFSERDAKVWQEEAVELFISPPTMFPWQYFEFQLSPGNVLRDLIVTHDSEGGMSLDGDWDCAGVETCVCVRECEGCYAWSAELGIPIKSLVPEAASRSIAGQTWMANFFRIDRRPRLEYSCWSPTFEPNFHVPEAFGRLVFSIKDQEMS